MLWAGLVLLFAAASENPIDRAIHLYQTRNFDAAEKQLRQLSSSNPRAHLYLVRTLIEQNRLPEALTELDRLLNTATDPEIKFAAGEILRTLAQRRLNALQTVAPGSAAVQELTGNELLRRGKFDEAIAAYNKAAQLEPNRPGLHYKLGTAFWRQRNLDPAEKHFRQELSLTPRHAMANLRLGQVLMAKDDAEAAIPPLELAAAALPNSSDVHRELGKAHRKLNNTAKARQHWEQSAKLNPNDDQIHFLLGRLYQQLGLKQQAAQELALHAQILAKRRGVSAQPQATP